MAALLSAPALASSASEASSECTASIVYENSGGSCTGEATGEYFAAASSCPADPGGLSVRTLYRDDDLDDYTTSGVCCIYYTDSSCATNTSYAEGWVDTASDDEDCDDDSSDVNPGASEVCDAANTDEDCDGGADNDDPEIDDVPDTDRYYQDCDGDGYGDETDFEGQLACDTPYSSDTTCSADGTSWDSGLYPSATWSLSNDDCDDTTEDAAPDVRERCDGIDNDCDTLVDGDDPDIVDDTAVNTYYIDDDGDGFGDPAGDTVEDCSLPTGYSVNDDDCDDADTRTYPGAEEICDGKSNACDLDVPSDELDADGDGYVECAFDGTIAWGGDGSVQAGWDCQPYNGAVYPGADEICNGIYDDCDRWGDGDTSSPGAPDDEVDDDGDGYSDCWDGTTIWRGTDEPSVGLDCDDDDDTVYPGAPEVCDGRYNDCDDSTDPLEAPSDEQDLDGDGYVECSWSGGVWSGSERPTGGDDCGPEDDTVYPDADELCDGQYNDCYADAGTQDAPDDELDDDGDGFVECADFSDASWVGDATVTGGSDCDGTDGTVYPDASELCDGQYNDCNDKAWSATEIPSDEYDDDRDGFVECVRYGSVTWNPPTSVDEPNTACDNGDADCYDCDDTDASTYPGAAELEDDLTVCTRDADGDGWGDDTIADGETVVAGSDCDDSDAEINPDAAEVCEDGDQVDSDCDGDFNTTDGVLIDGGGTLAYIDADGDSYGSNDADDAVYVCDITDGYSNLNTDCDDTDETVYTSAPELCDGIDNDCDSAEDEVDDLDPKLSGCVDMYADVDDDGYGDDTIDTACLCLSEDGLTATDGADTYVLLGGDCDDSDPDIHPLSCYDGLDNDGDGLTDQDDPFCQEDPPLGEFGLEREEKLETLDGHDNDCDGYIPAIELDCDDDGALPALPIFRSVGETAEDFGLTPCYEDGQPETMSITCWDTTIELECPADRTTTGLSGLWMARYDAADADAVFTERFSGGARVYSAGTACDAELDCDDQCASRCPGVSESCDGIDNDCSSATAAVDSDGDGLPDAMEDDAAIPGTLASSEIDLDQDGFLACGDFSSSDSQIQWSSKSCSDAISDETYLDDCNDLCALSTPGATEVCNGFTDVCYGDDEGLDDDRDIYRTCGAWGADDAAVITEEIYVLVWISDETSSTTTTADTGDTGEVEDDPGADTAPDTESDTEAGETGEDDDTGGSDSYSVPDLVPLVPPRPAIAASGDTGDSVPYVECDADLYQAQSALLATSVSDGTSLVEAAMYSSADENDILNLLDICTGSARGGSCTVVRLTLGEDVDEETHADGGWLTEARSVGVLDDACEAAPEQYLSRAVWSRDRILQARRLVTEWECERMFGRRCENVDSDSEVVTGWDTIVDPSRYLTSNRTWWKELRRYSPEGVSEGGLAACWGEPADGFNNSDQYTGGDCSDGDDATNRDTPEGPGDLMGIYLYGEGVDCSTCLDGLDNNCDGNIDCDDPSCAPCFVGQGFGCGASDSPCDGANCASGGSVPARSPLGFALAMLTLVLRRWGRERSAG